MQLSKVEVGLKFTYEGATYVHDLSKRAGSGEIPVKNVDTGETSRLPASSKVEIVEDAKVDEQVVAEQNKEEPSREEMFPDQAPAEGKRIPKRQLGDEPRETVKPSFKEVDAPPHNPKR